MKFEIDTSRVIVLINGEKYSAEATYNEDTKILTVEPDNQKANYTCEVCGFIADDMKTSVQGNHICDECIDEGTDIYRCEACHEVFSYKQKFINDICHECDDNLEREKHFVKKWGV